MSTNDSTASIVPKRACGFKTCCVSTAIDETTLTFGRGRLDDWGFWQHPCGPCARSYEQRNGLPAGACWPFPKPKE